LIMSIRARGIRILRSFIDVGIYLQIPGLKHDPLSWLPHRAIGR
jgi:hypothetical protein